MLPSASNRAPPQAKPFLALLRTPASCPCQPPPPCGSNSREHALLRHVSTLAFHCGVGKANRLTSIDPLAAVILFGLRRRKRVNCISSSSPKSLACGTQKEPRSAHEMKMRFYGHFCLNSFLHIHAIPVAACASSAISRTWLGRAAWPLFLRRSRPHFFLGTLELMKCPHIQ